MTVNLTLTRTSGAPVRPPHAIGETRTSAVQLVIFNELDNIREPVPLVHVEFGILLLDMVVSQIVAMRHGEGVFPRLALALSHQEGSFKLGDTDKGSGL